MEMGLRSLFLLHPPPKVSISHLSCLFISLLLWLGLCPLLLTFCLALLFQAHVTHSKHLIFFVLGHFQDILASAWSRDV